MTNHVIAVLFSLFSIVPRKSFDLRVALKRLKRVKAVLLEEFRDGPRRKALRYVVHHRINEKWKVYELSQQFGSLTSMSHRSMSNFVANDMPKRFLGNCCVLLCGESNGVKYLPRYKKVDDTFGMRAAMTKGITIVLNPIHDRMTRFEMDLKRKFLSKKGRWVVSVWNKGKEDRNGNTKDGRRPAWAIYYDGNRKDIESIPNALDVEIGILDIKKA